MRQAGAPNDELFLITELSQTCDEVSSLIEAFFDVGAERENKRSDASIDVERRQVKIFDDLRLATARLSTIPATTPPEVAMLARIVEDLREKFDYCGLDELSALSRSHERALSRLVLGDGERVGQAGWIGRRIFGMLGWGDQTTQH